MAENAILWAAFGLVIICGAVGIAGACFLFRVIWKMLKEINKDFE